MGILKSFTVYHATDKIYVDSIVKDNFIFYNNPEHWLGNGIYFFMDKLLAIEWSKNPTKKYGIIKDPSIIEAVVKTDEDYLCDMRLLETYNIVKELFEKYLRAIDNKNYTLNKHDVYKLRCSFFDWLIIQLKLECLISYFNERPNLSHWTSNGDVFNKFKTPYIEVQVCVPNNKAIIHRKMIQ